MVASETCRRRLSDFSLHAQFAKKALAQGFQPQGLKGETQDATPPLA